jgi:hypothetical protein
VAAQVAVSLQLLAPHMEATPVVLRERSQREAPLAPVLVEQRMQAAAAVAIGVAAAVLHTPVAEAVLLLTLFLQVLEV